MNADEGTWNKHEGCYRNFEEIHKKFLVNQNLIILRNLQFWLEFLVPCQNYVYMFTVNLRNKPGLWFIMACLTFMLYNEISGKFE